MTYKIILDEWVKGFALRKNNDVLCKTHIVEADTLQSLYEKIYAKERADRYAHRYYKFRDFDIENSYKNWKRHRVTIDMYYGTATVD